MDANVTKMAKAQPNQHSRVSRLPALRSPGRENSPHDWQQQGYPLPDTRTVSRIDILEERLSRQERQASNAMEHALRIKEDITSNFDMARGIWQDDKQARHLLQEHIRTITDVVRKITGDIQMLESKLELKQSSSADTRSVVNNLEVHQVAGITDLRGRVARCDGAITRLAADLKNCVDNVNGQQQQEMNHQAQYAERLRHIDLAMAELSARADKAEVRQETAIRNLEGGTSQQMAAIDSATRVAGETARHTVEGLKNHEVTERERMEARIMTHVDKMVTITQQKQEKLEKQFSESLQHVHEKLELLKEEQRRTQEENKQANQAMEHRLRQDLSETSKKLMNETSRVKAECRSGFSAVRDSMSTMRELLDDKRNLLQEQIKKDIRHLQKMVVLI